MYSRGRKAQRKDRAGSGAATGARRPGNLGVVPILRRAGRVAYPAPAKGRSRGAMPGAAMRKGRDVYSAVKNHAATKTAAWQVKNRRLMTAADLWQQTAGRRRRRKGRRPRYRAAAGTGARFGLFQAQGKADEQIDPDDGQGIVKSRRIQDIAAERDRTEAQDTGEVPITIPRGAGQASAAARASALCRRRAGAWARDWLQKRGVCEREQRDEPRRRPDL